MNDALRDNLQTRGLIPRGGFVPLAADTVPHPLDRWSRAIGDALAQEIGGLALYPFGGPKVASSNLAPATENSAC